MMRKFVLVPVYLLLIALLAACGSAASTAAVSPEASAPASEASSPAERPGPWDASPAMTIDPEAIYVATLHTEKGDIQVELFADRAPVTVNNFIFLAEQGYYNDITFHRVIPDFMAQTGDPTGTGTGGPGYTFEDEISHGLTFDRAGLLAMANVGVADSNGSQFFLTYGPAPWLNGMHTIFGQVISGMDVLDQLTARDPEQSPDFAGDRLISVEVKQVQRSEIPTPTPGPEPIVPEPTEGRPLADIPPVERGDLYTGMPAMAIDLNKSYSATIETTQGKITVELKPLSAPKSVNNFVVLARLGYWDSFPIVTTQPGAFVLTGSPAGRQDSDIGYVLPSENGSPATAGALGYWFRQDQLASSGSQIFITLDDLTGMEEFYTIFGYVTSGLEVAQNLTTDDQIVRISIQEK